MKRRIGKVAVLGAGVMGSGIAAHLSGVGLDVLLLDIPNRDADPGDKKARNAIVNGALGQAQKAKPALFHDPDDVLRIETGNFADDMARISECDWIVEVVKEDLGIKRKVFEQVDALRRPGALVSSNTSGLSIAAMAEGRSDDFRSHFLVTHFFNPVRYMRLLEVVPGPETDPEVFAWFQRFGEDVLGKGVVVGKDTPNFVANRIGVFALMETMRVMEDMELSIEDVDTIAGKPMGRPRSAAFRTADLVGLDTFTHVADHCYESLVDDERREVFKVPEWMRELVKSGYLGDKTRKGFYEKTREGRLVFDWKTRTHKGATKPTFESVDAVKRMDEPGARVAKLVSGDDAAAKFAWRVLAETLAYSARRMGEIADALVDVDRGMRWGFNWEQGPFEAWDAIGVKEGVERMEQDGITVPAWVKEFLAAGNERFYVRKEGVTSVWNPTTKKYEALVPREGFLFLQDIKDRRAPIFENESATVLDLGDGIAGVEFHTKLNALDDKILAGIHAAVDWAENEGVGVVIGNENAAAFSAGANLMLIYQLAEAGEFDKLDAISKSFQDAYMRLKYARVPVVAAPHGLTLGGGCELTLHASGVQAGAETYMGLVEVGVGLIPGAGGTKELVFRMVRQVPDGVAVQPMPLVQKAFENIALGKVATGAGDARRMGYLRTTDGITYNPDRLIADAKKRALAMADLGYAPPRREQAVLPGKDGETVLHYALDDFRGKGMASDHDVLIGRKVAHVLCGGDVSSRHPVSEQHVLDLEREAFVSLCGEPKTRERILHMLKTNKPLRN